MKRNFVIATIILLLSSLAACKKQTPRPEHRMLMVSVEPQRKILEQLAGDNFEIATMLPAGISPETFEPTASHRIKAAQAEAFFPTGYLPYEDDMERELKGKARIYDTSSGIVPILGTHSHGDGEEGEEDPHTWVSLQNARLISSNMAAALAKLDPENAALYAQRQAEYVAYIDSIDAQVSDMLKGVHAFAIWHPSLSYFARDYGLHQISVGHENKEVSLTALKEIIDEARQDSVRVFFVQREFDTRQAESINKEIGSRIVTINPLAYDWDLELVRVANELVK